MIECALAWIFLFAGLFAKEPICFVASGVFAIAAQICISRERGNNDNRKND